MTTPEEILATIDTLHRYRMKLHLDDFWRWRWFKRPRVPDLEDVAASLRSRLLHFQVGTVFRGMETLEKEAWAPKAFMFRWHIRPYADLNRVRDSLNNAAASFAAAPIAR
jgi:hypothetical protein